MIWMEILEYENLLNTFLQYQQKQKFSTTH